MVDINLNGIFKKYGDTQTIHGVDLDISNGEFVVFVGPSGCGKSTLLRMIAGLESISDGTLQINQQVMNEVAPSERGVAMVFQSYALYPHMTVKDNIGFALKMHGKDKAEIERRVNEVAAILQLENLLHRKPKALSGGQRQRVAIGRAIIRDPNVFLFDEPLSNLDAELRVEMRRQIAELHRKLKRTMIYVTHDQVEAMTLADKIVVLNQGRIEQVGSPIELYKSPKNRFVAGFIGSPKMNFIKATVQQSDSSMTVVTLSDGQSLELPPSNSGLKIGMPVEVGIRPEDITMGTDASSGLQFTPTSSERLGGSTYLFGEVANHNDIKIHLSGDIDISSNNIVNLTIEKNKFHLFDESGKSIHLL
ncbi:sn-glycerol-3-phosphate ABC transporter ATP-binding protein UgpC (plasmid) [Photobacterium sp. DA100]|uniref:ABC transporter ATP-binding protein n=1 Tax=Photobacterium sp. DA100 TaxID=3027472 RepID=UPI0024788260|nr:sn-glycerol-3-phosphate ABC transporter ATP-binding protein UgpC [Photobacterium sp. DA100]WEM45523.1 sn-glycerol-3-phosphate ABC transporter ATP-binding protein UgpC [Photobacterium sp. DA100]